MSGDEFHYKGWRVEVLHQEAGWKALIFRPSSPLHEVEVPVGPDRRVVMETAKAQIDKLLGGS